MPSGVPFRCKHVLLMCTVHFSRHSVFTSSVSLVGSCTSLCEWVWDCPTKSLLVCHHVLWTILMSLHSRQLQNICLRIAFTCKTGPKQQNTGERVQTEAPPQRFSPSWGWLILSLGDCRFDLWPPLIQGDRLHWMHPFKYILKNENKKGTQEGLSWGKASDRSFF